MIGLFDQSKSPPLIRELPLNDSLARSGETKDSEYEEYENEYYNDAGQDYGVTVA